jgi:hypothetical protein
VERQVKHEYDPGWKQLGSLANGVLRSVAEKRIKQAEFLAAEIGSLEAPAQAPRAESRLQLVLPLPPVAAPLGFSGAGRF